MTSSSKRLLGIDPGTKNVGWALREHSGIWQSGVKIVHGTLADKTVVLAKWLQGQLQVDLVAIEVLLGGMHQTTFELAVIPVLAAYLCYHKKIPLALVYPSTHYAHISGRGKYGDAYDIAIEQITKLGVNISKHEKTAAGSVITALADYNEESEFLRGRVKWLVRD